MAVDIRDVETIARLARIQIDRESSVAYAQAMSRILALVEQMNAADTSGVAPMANPHDLTARLRPDEITEAVQRDNFQTIAPATEAGLYLVPQVIE